MFNISVTFKDTKKVDQIFESSSEVQYFFESLCHLSIFGNQRRYSSRLSIPMLIGTPCREKQPILEFFQELKL